MSSNSYEYIEGSKIRSMLRSRGLPGGGETICCGGRKRFSRDYTTQLKRLGYKGSFKVTENGVITAFITI